MKQSVAKIQLLVIGKATLAYKAKVAIVFSFVYFKEQPLGYT